MIALNGTYYNGHLELDSPVKSDKPLRVIVTFLEENIELEEKKKPKKQRFSFQRSRELLRNYKGSLSDAVIEERREEQ